jgi:hypothetical protein
MPRDGSNVYHIPAGTQGIPDQSIESNKYNVFIADIEQDLNLPRPIIAGGTGATNVDDALNTLGGEKASQVVTNFDSQLWYPGSFYAAATATSSPVAGHAFVGWVYSSDPPAVPPANNNLVVEARDQNDTVVPGSLWVREKKVGVWGPWTKPAAAQAPLDSPVLTGDPQVPTPASGDHDKSIANTEFVANSLIAMGTVLQTSIDTKAPINSPVLTGDPQAPDQTAGDNDQSIANTKFVNAAIAAAATVHATVAEFRANSAPTHVVDVGTVWGAAAPVLLVSGVAPDFSLGLDFQISGGGSVTVANPVNTKVGQKGVFMIVGPTATWGTAYKFANGIKPTTTGTWNVISYIVWDASTILCSTASALS